MDNIFALRMQHIPTEIVMIPGFSYFYDGAYETYTKKYEGFSLHAGRHLRTDPGGIYLVSIMGADGDEVIIARQVGIEEVEAIARALDFLTAQPSAL